MAEQAPQQSAAPREQTTADLIDRLSKFDGPPEMFLVNLLAVQCRLASASGGAIVRAAQQAQPEILAVYPPLQQNAAAPVWLASAVEAAASVAGSAQTVVKPLHSPEDMYGSTARRQLILVPLRGTSGVRGLAAFVMESADMNTVKSGIERLEISSSLLSLYEMRLTLQRRNLDLQRVRIALETLADVNDHNSFMGAAMALCNELSSRWSADRVSLGFLKGRYVQLKAMSHTEKFSRKMKLVQDIESAMEECLDQDIEIIYPSSPQDTYVAREAGELARRHGPSTVLSMPLRRDGQVEAVVTVERPADSEFNLEEIESLRLTGELCTARLVGLHKTDRWFGARMASSIRDSLAKFLQPKHTWLKLAAIGIFALLVFLVFAKGQYKVDAEFVFDASQRRTASVPFDGQIIDVLVKSGDLVKAGDVLAKLKTYELEMQLAKAKADYQTAMNTARQAMAENKNAEVIIAEKQAESHLADIKILEYRIAQADIKAPIDGYIITPDQDKLIGTPVQQGAGLFEISPLGDMWAQLTVGEDQIGDVRIGQKGELAAVGDPGNHISFEIESITMLAQVVDQKNVFKVRARLLDVNSSTAELAQLYLPGSEGQAKIEVGRRRLAWIWTRKLINWLRMKLWI